MSFVEWATLVVLLVVGAIGLYAGIASLVGRRLGQTTHVTRGQRERVLVALLYLLGGVAALAVAILWLLSRSR